MMKTKLFKVEAEGDTVYFKAKSLEHAKEKFENICGYIPDSIVHWEEIDELPEGEEAL